MLGAVALACVFLAVTRTRGAWIGGACGLGTTLLAVRPRASRVWVGGALAAAIVAAAVAASAPSRFNPRDAGDNKRYSGIGDVLQESFDGRSTALRTRFGLWRRTVAMIADAPLLGVGPGNWPVVFPRYAEPGARATACSAPRSRRDRRTTTSSSARPRRASSALAALGFLAGSLAVAARRRLRDGRRGDAHGGGGGGRARSSRSRSLAVASFPLEMPGTLALAGLAVGLIAPEIAPGARARPRLARHAGGRTRTSPPGWCCWSSPPSAPIAMCGAAGGSRRPSAALRHAHDEAGAAVAMGALNLALEANPDDFRARLRASQMLLREHRAGEARRCRPPRASVASHTRPNARAALAAAELEAGDLEAARADASLALALLHEYPFALTVRAEAAARLGDAEASARDRAALATLAHGPENDDTARAARTLLLPAD